MRSVAERVSGGRFTDLEFEGKIDSIARSIPRKVTS